MTQTPSGDRTDPSPEGDPGSESAAGVGPEQVPDDDVASGPRPEDGPQDVDQEPDYEESESDDTDDPEDPAIHEVA